MPSILILKRAQTFALCYSIFLGILLCRQTWSIVSGHIVQHMLVVGFDKSFLGTVNFAFLFAYGCAVLILGKLGDVMNPKTFLLTGQFMTGIIFGTIGLAHHYEVNHRMFILAMMILNGIAQSPTWPGVVTIIDNWFPKKGKIIVMGCFASCANMGDITGDIIGGIMIGRDGDKIFWPVIVAGGYMLISALISVLFLKASPHLNHELSRSAAYQKSVTEDPLAKPIKISYLSAWMIPGVATYAAAFGCIKAVLSTIGSWLPTYLLEQPNVNNITYILAMIDLGSIPGGISISVIGLKTGKRALIIMPTLSLGIITVIGTNYLQSIANPFWDYIGIVFMIGFFIGGVSNMIIAGIPVELGRQFKNNKKAVATTTSIIEGYGNIFAALNQLVVPHIISHLFLYCGFLLIICGIFLSPQIKGELFPAKKNPLSDELSEIFEDSIY